jgi:hypothetical protein
MLGRPTFNVAQRFLGGSALVRQSAFRHVRCERCLGHRYRCVHVITVELGLSLQLSQVGRLAV